MGSQGVGGPPTLREDGNVQLQPDLVGDHDSPGLGRPCRVTGLSVFFEKNLHARMPRRAMSTGCLPGPFSFP